MPPPPAIHSYEPATAQIQILDESLHPAGKIWPSFVALDFHLPYLVDGMKSTQVNFFSKYRNLYMGSLIIYFI
jgi:hypothetical protein